MSMKTQTIAGHSITLEEGRRYLASRPFLSKSCKEYPVSITGTGEDGFFEGKPTLVIPQLSIDAANELLNAFNNEKMSLTGRVW